MSFPRYPKYQTSGVEWLGDVPEHWAVKPLKVVASFNDDVLPESFDAEEEIEYVDIGSVSLAGGIERTETFLYGNAPSRARRKVQDGDVIASTVRTYLKAIAPVIAPSPNMIVSTGFAVIRPGVGLISHFAKFALQTNYFVDSVISRSTGVSYPAINASEMAGIVITVPPLAEQTAIAAFLDRETGKIDELVAEQRRLMELLKEKRQAVISHAVTQGLNPQAPMKPSGIEWFGQIPEHWSMGFKLKTLAIRKVAAFTNGPFGSDLLTAELQDEGVPVIYIRDLKVSGYRRTSSSFVTPEKALQLDKFRADPMDVLIAKVGDPPGFCCIYPRGEPPGIICQDVIRLKPNWDLVDSDYICYLLNSRPGIEAIDAICIQLTRKRFSLEDLHSLRLPIPPKKEQIQISQFLSDQSAQFDTLTAEAQRAIDLLQERRTTLISAAVTGQIDVRAIASN